MQRSGHLARAAIIAGTVAVAVSGVGISAAASASTHANPTSARPAAHCPAGRWHKPPITVTRNFHVPPTPVVKAVRTAKHMSCRFDRLVFDISGRTPGYHIQFVKQIIADGSGKPIKLPGKRFLLITLRPAQAHRGSGGSTLPTKVQVIGDPMLRSWVLAGDFEGVVSIGIGLHAKTSVRVGELRGRLYIDFKY
jgi:hypothetical protein